MNEITLSKNSRGSKYDAVQFFDNFAQAFDTIYDGKRNFFMQWVDRRFRRDMFIRFALSFEALGDLKGKTVLDIGCGSGPYVVEALNRGASQVTAVDPAPHMLALVRERLKRSVYADKCLLIQGAFPGIDLKAHDHVMIMGVMDYIADARGFLTALRPLVTTSAVVSFPSKHWFRTPLRRFRYRLRRCPVYFYDEAQIMALCSAAGFGRMEINKISGAGMDYHVCLKP
jgi:cyclopropane fatty-acyl-phospholipid synthase-like methyltransferase